MEISVSKSTSLSDLYFQLAKKQPVNFKHFDKHFKEVLTVVTLTNASVIKTLDFVGHAIVLFTAKYKNSDRHLIFSVGASDIPSVDAEGDIHHMEIIATVDCEESKLPELEHTMFSILCHTIMTPLHVSNNYPESNVLRMLTGKGEAKKIRYFGLLRDDDFKQQVTEEKDMPFLLTPFYITPDEMIELTTDPKVKQDVVNDKKLAALMDSILADDNDSAFIDYNRPSVDLSQVGCKKENLGSATGNMFLR